MTETRSRHYLGSPSLITCVVERGRADEVVKAAMKAGAPAATIHFARGSGVRERLSLILRIAISPEKEVIDIVAPGETADAVFEAMVEAGRLDLPGKGFIYMMPVTKALTHLPAPGEAAGSESGR